MVKFKHPNSFSNPSPIVIPQVGATGNAAPFPASIEVRNQTSSIKKVTVTIRNLVHSFPADIHMLLIGPQGQSAYLMGNIGNSFSINGVTITFDDAALNMLPTATPLVSGTYRPTLFGPADSDLPNTIFGSNTSLSVFEGTNPNGVWTLYVLDALADDTGFISDGWTLTIYS